MRLHVLAVGVFLFVNGAVLAQELMPEVREQTPELIEVPLRPSPGEPVPDDEEAPPAGRPRTVETQAFGITTVDPNVSVTLGNSTSTSAFTVFSLDNATRFLVLGDGRVGIGTSSPSQFFDVVRDLAGATMMRISNSDAGTSVTASYTGIRFTQGVTQAAEISSINSGSTGVAGGARSLRVWNYLDAPLLLATNNTERLRIFGNGNVSIGGTTDTGATLQVVHARDGGYGMFISGNETIEASTTQDDYGMYIQEIATVNSGVTNSGSVVGARVRGMVGGTGTQQIAYGARLDAGLTGGGALNSAIAAWTEIWAGTGTITNGIALYIPDVPATKDYGVYQTSANDSNYFAGDVGIGYGVTAPAAKLHVHDTLQLPRVVLSGSEMYEPAVSGSPLAGIGLYVGVNRTSNRQLWVGDANASSPVFRVTAQSAATMIDAIARDGVTPTTLTVGVNGNLALTTGTGRVGIGTSTPNAAYKLHVVGNAHFDGSVTGTNIRATYQDVAEWVPATTDLEPGTVVVLNTTRNNEVMASHASYDTRVAGVVSAQPGLSLGLEGEGKEQIATYGRVKVKVDARTHPISVGDLLVTSEISGAAMRSVPIEINGRNFHQPGTIIGKALEPLESGIGEILVLLSMQ